MWAKAPLLAMGMTALTIRCAVLAHLAVISDEAIDLSLDVAELRVHSRVQAVNRVPPSAPSASPPSPGTAPAGRVQGFREALGKLLTCQRSFPNTLDLTDQCRAPSPILFPSMLSLSVARPNHVPCAAFECSFFHACMG